METSEELQKILDDSPRGERATHIDCEGDYWIMHPDSQAMFNDCDGWNYCEPQEPLRSLADIQRIVDLMKLASASADVVISQSELINKHHRAFNAIGSHIQKSQPSFCMGGVDSDDEFSSASKVIEYIESLEVYNKTI